MSTPVPTTRGRDLRIDALRGIFIVSMTAGHLAGGTAVDYLAHPLRWVDGAAGFVLFSGLVLGMMLRARARTEGTRTGVAWLLRRARFLYLAHVALTVTGVLARSATGRPDFLPSVDELGGPVPALAGIALLRVQPPYLNVLPLYVVLLAVVAPLCLLALTRRRWSLVLVPSVLLYAAGQADPGLLHVADLVSTPGTWAWACWQLLFVGGLIAGWHWRDSVRPWLVEHRRPVVVSAVAVTAVLAVLANAFDLLAGSAGRFAPLVAASFDKYALRPGVVVYLLAAVVVTYVVLGRLHADGPGAAVSRRLATIGSRSLDCYLMLSAVQLVVLGLWPVRPAWVSAVLLAATLVVMHRFALLRAGGARLRLPRRADGQPRLSLPAGSTVGSPGVRAPLPAEPRLVPVG